MLCGTAGSRYMVRSGVGLTVLNVHRLLISALCLAAKWRDDHYFSNDFGKLEVFEDGSHHPGYEDQ